MHQLVNAERWLSEEIKRLEREGWVIIDDCAYKELPGD